MPSCGFERRDVRRLEVRPEGSPQDEEETNTYLLKFKHIQIQAGRPKKRFLFGHLLLNITNVFCAKKRMGHACICPRMVSG